MKFSDKEILTQIKNGDPMRVMDSLYIYEFPKLRKYILANSGTEEDAKDMFQEAIMTLFTHVKMNKYKEQYEVGGFLYIVGVNRWKKHNKKGIKTVELMDHDMDSTVDSTYDQVFSKERRDLIDQLFKQLGENCEELMKMILFLKKSLKEVTEHFGYTSVTTTKTRHYKCKQKLIKIVKSSPEMAQQVRFALTA